MSGSHTPQLLDNVWEYSLFDALYGRRSRRFGLGFEMTEGPFRYKSKHPAVPLTEIEEALLVGAGAGFSGLPLWDFSTPAPYRARSGRTFPSTTSGGHTTLFFTNDAGFYVLDADVGASKLREIETPDERGKILATYRERRRELSRGRLDIPRRTPPYSAHDLWDSNMPGSTLEGRARTLIAIMKRAVGPPLLK